MIESIECNLVVMVITDDDPDNAWMLAMAFQTDDEERNGVNLMIVNEIPPDQVEIELIKLTKRLEVMFPGVPIKIERDKEFRFK